MKNLTFALFLVLQASLSIGCPSKGDVDSFDSSTEVIDEDNDGFFPPEDCDDTDPSINPGTEEICDNRDNDCDGTTDENGAADAPTYYRDADSDGWGNVELTLNSCSTPEGYVTNDDDCDDANSEINPSASEICDYLDNNCDGRIDYDDITLIDLLIWYRDDDSDSYGDSTNSLYSCWEPDGYVDNSTDCDDTDSAINPGVAEICDSLDNDCDNLIDDEDDSVSYSMIWYFDSDDDGYGTSATTAESCEAPERYVANATDCDDTNTNIYPDAPETDCTDPIDYNCDGSVGYADEDGDGYAACVDCDDTTSDVYPIATEVCDGIDNDCDDFIDDEDLDVSDRSNWYLDFDNDDYGDPMVSIEVCEPPSGYVENDGDCDDINPLIHHDAEETDCTDPIDYNCDGSVGYADEDGDGYAACVDCDDANSDVHPGTIEICNDLDDDCDRYTDNVDTEHLPVWYFDDDDDGFGDSSIAQLACDPPIGYIRDSSDCDDTNTDIHPGSTEICDSVDNDCDGTVDENDAVDIMTWYLDADSDTYGNSTVTVEACEAPEGYVADTTDCDDTNSDIHPDAAEICDEVDNDCDDLIDDEDDSISDTTIWYLDADGDGYGTHAVSNAGEEVDTESCTAPIGYVADDTDCDDTNADIYPEATEICNNYDDNCDGSTDEGVATTYYADIDGDGYGDPLNVTGACSDLEGYTENDGDCDDSRSDIHPGITEICNGMDDNCDGAIDDEDSSVIGRTTWYFDRDGDGYGSLIDSIYVCEMSEGFTTDSTDCDDTNINVHPGATETCDGTDNNCDGTIDEGATITYYRDSDGDGYGTSATTAESCEAPEGYVGNSADCDDTDVDTHPEVTEICNSLDDDCDGETDEGVKNTYFVDTDGDGYGDPATMAEDCDVPEGYTADATDCDDTNILVNPGAGEICDSLDNDCDSETDELVLVKYYADLDGDHCGEAIAGEYTDIIFACSAPEGYITGDEMTCDMTVGDCDDTDPTRFGGAVETCDDLDDDCDGLIDEGVKTIYYMDGDSDDYGDSLSTTEACVVPDGYVEDNTDCDDTDSDINPGAYEIFYNPSVSGSLIDNCGDGKDNDCNGYADADDAVCGDEDEDGIFDGVDALFPCDMNGDGADESLCLWVSQAWESPWSEGDFVPQPISDVESLNLSTIQTAETVAWGGEEIDVCVIEMTGYEPEIYTYRWVSDIGVDGESSVDPDDCGDWVPMDLTNFCSDFSDSFCATSTKDDGCGRVGGTIDFRWTGVSVIPD